MSISGFQEDYVECKINNRFFCIIKVFTPRELRVWISKEFAKKKCSLFLIFYLVFAYRFTWTCLFEEESLDELVKIKDGDYIGVEICVKN